MKQKLHILITLLMVMISGGVFGQTFKKITSESDLKAGDVIAIVNESSKVAMGSDKGSNRASQSITIKNEEFTFVEGVQEISLEGESGKWSFNVGDGYLCAASNKSNYLKTKSSIDANAQASITFSSGNAVIKFVGSYTHNLIRFNSTNNLNIFACYTSGQQPVQIYKKETSGSDKTSTTLSFGSDYDGKTITKKIGDYYEALATLSPAVDGATITYTSSDETVAEIADGVVEAKKEGTTTITASYAGDDTYAASSVSYTLNVVDDRTATTLTFPNDSYTYTLGDQNGTAIIEDNVAILSPENAGNVTYSVTGTEGLAELDGTSVLVNTNIIGTATVTASFAGDDNYKPSEASYTITVKVLEETFDFRKPGNYGYGATSGSPTYGTGAGDVLEGGSVVSGNVKLTHTKKASSGMRFYSDGLRVYKDVKLTLSVDNGFVIKDVKCEKSKGTLSIGKLNNREVTIDITSNATLTSMTVTYAKLPTATLTTAASGFATYAADYDVDYSAANLEAYAVKVDEANMTVTYTQTTGVVPAGEAVLVKGESKTSYTLTPATETATDIDTDLKISDGSVTTADSKFYGFATVNGVSGFKLISNGLTIPAKKGYLELTSGENAKSFFEFTPGTTGISDYKVDVVKANDKIYNMAGQRVNNSYKGLVIKNGKKYVK